MWQGNVGLHFSFILTTSTTSLQEKRRHLHWSHCLWTFSKSQLEKGIFSRLASHLSYFQVGLIFITDISASKTYLWWILCQWGIDVSVCSPSFAFDVLDCLLRHKKDMSDPVNYFERFFPSLFKVVLATWHVCVLSLCWGHQFTTFSLDIGLASYFIPVRVYRSPSSHGSNQVSMWGEGYMYIAYHIVHMLQCTVSVDSLQLPFTWLCCRFFMLLLIFLALLLCCSCTTCLKQVWLTQSMPIAAICTDRGVSACVSHLH